MPVLRLKRREDWAAVPPLRQDPSNRKPATKVFISYHTPDFGWTNSNSRDCGKILLEMQKRHMNNFGFSDIAYHFIVAGDGYVYEGRDVTTTTPTALKYPVYHGNRIDIAFMGDYLKHNPPMKMIEFSFMIADYCIKEGHLHRLFTYTTIKEMLEVNNNESLSDKLPIVSWQ